MAVLVVPGMAVLVVPGYAPPWVHRSPLGAVPGMARLPARTRNTAVPMPEFTMTVTGFPFTIH